jgi:hypothetical protein
VLHVLWQSSGAVCGRSHLARERIGPVACSTLRFRDDPGQARGGRRWGCRRRQPLSAYATGQDRRSRACMDGTCMSLSTYRPPQLMELSKIDRRFSSLRLAAPEDLRRLQQSIQSDGGVRDPLLVSTGVEPEHWVLVDGFKRLSVALEMGSTHLWVLTAQLDAAHAKAAIMHCNQPREGLCALEEAWLVRSLCDQGIPRKDVAQLLRRDEPWVSRRMKIATNLEKSLQDDVTQGLLSTAAACNLSQLQRDNQPAVAQAGPSPIRRARSGRSGLARAGARAHQVDGRPGPVAPSWAGELPRTRSGPALFGSSCPRAQRCIDSPAGDRKGLEPR